MRALTFLLLAWAGTALAQPAVPTPEEAAREALRAPDPPPARPPWLEPAPGGLTADQAAARAVSTAPSVRRASLARDVASAASDEAASAFAPRVDFTGSYTRINEVDLPPFELFGMTVDNPFPQILDNWNMRVAVAVPVSDYFLTIWPAYEATQGFAEAARLGVEVERQQTALRAREAFYNLLRARGGVWVAEQAIASLEATQRDVEGLVRAGISSRADLAQVRSQLASARAMHVQARGQARVAERALHRLMHAPEGEPIAIGEDLFAAGPGARIDEQEMLRLANDRRSEVRALRATVSAREALLRARYGSMAPRFVLTGQADTASPNQRIVPATTEIYTTWAAGGAIMWSPNDLATGIHRVRQAEAELAQAREDLSQLEDGLAIEAAQVAAAHEAASESIAAAEEGVTAAEQALADRRSMMGAGVATSTEVMQAQLALTRAQLDRIGAYVELRLARARAARLTNDAAPSN